MQRYTKIFKISDFTSKHKINLWYLQELEENRKAKRNKLPGNDSIKAKLIEAGGRKIRSETHKFINSIRSKEELPEQWKE